MTFNFKQHLSRTAAAGTGKMGHMRWWNWKMSRAGNVQGLNDNACVLQPNMEEEWQRIPQW